jgi:hypothetical protein
MTVMSGMRVPAKADDGPIPPGCLLEVRGPINLDPLRFALIGRDLAYQSYGIG